MHYSTGKKGYDQFFGNSKSFCLSDSALSDQNWKGLFVLDQKMRVNCMLGGGYLCFTKIIINSCTSNLFFLLTKTLIFFRSMTLKTHVWFAGLKLIVFRCFCDPRHGFKTRWSTTWWPALSFPSGVAGFQLCTDQKWTCQLRPFFPW